MDLGNLEETLKHKYGPLPGYAWVGIGTLGIVLVAKAHSKATGTTPTPVNVSPLSSGALDGSSSGGGGGGGFDSSILGSGSDGGVIQTDAPIGNPTPIASAPIGAAPAVNAPTAVQLTPFAAAGLPDYGLPTYTTDPAAEGVANVQTLVVASGGQNIGQYIAPVHDISRPASDYYTEIGHNASDPITILPTPLPPAVPLAPEDVIRIAPRNGGAIPV